MNDLKPCPFCGTPATISPIYGDWWRLRAPHKDGCFFPHDHEMTVPQDDDSKAWLIQVWNRRAPDARLAAQLRECADTLGADRIDEHRAMRAYADSMALLAEMPHISRTPAGDAALKEQ